MNLGGPSAVSYAAVIGEYGITNYAYPPGDARRYGITADGSTDWENGGQFDIWAANCCLPGVIGYLAPGYYASGKNLRAVYSGARFYFPPGVELGNVWHMIGGGTQATATTTMAAGAIDVVTVTAKGAGYFHPPLIAAYGSSGGNTLTGVTLTPVMEADAIDTYVAAGSGYAVNDTITLQNGVVLTVSTVDGAGGVTAATITTRGTIADPSVAASGTAIVGNRYAHQSTSGSGSGAMFLIGFRVASVTVTAAGSGGPASATIYIDPPALKDVRCEGEIVSYGRLGVQSTVDCYVERFHGKSDTDKNTDGIRQPGAHIDYNENFRFGDILMDDAGDGTGNTGWAAVSIDAASGWRAARKVTGNRIYVKKCDVNGVGINGDVDIGEVRVDAFGADSSVASTRYFGPSGANSEAHGLYIYRATGRIGTVRIGQNDQTIGSSALYHVMITSTGLYAVGTAPPHSTVDNLDVLTNYTKQGFTFGDVVLTNVSRQGGFVVTDRNNVDSNGADVTVDGRIVAQRSKTTAMTAGYQIVQMNTPGTGPSLRAQLGVGDIVITDIQNDDAIKTDTSTLLAFRLLRIPYHGSGTLAHFKGRASGRIDIDQVTNIGLATAGSNPMVKLDGVDTAESVIEVYANATDNNGQFQVLLLADTVKCRVSGYIRHYRNRDIVETSGTNVDLDLGNLYIEGVGDSIGNSIKLGGTLTRPNLHDIYTTAHQVGIKNNSVTITGGRSRNIQYGSHASSNTDLPAINYLGGENSIILSAVTGDTTATIPPGYALRDIAIYNTTANAVTGGIKIGTTSGAVDVVAAQAVGANAYLLVPAADILLRLFSATASQTLFIQDVTAWNSASLNIVITLDRVIP